MEGPSDEGDDDLGGGRTAAPDGTPESKAESDRDLGVIEAIIVVSRSCPNGGVIKAAERALDAIKTGGPDTLKEQAYFVLTAIQGWRGERARQVHRSLSRYLDLARPDNNTSNTSKTSKTPDHGH
jgi:hypothetical protein